MEAAPQHWLLIKEGGKVKGWHLLDLLTQPLGSPDLK
jgi:hypothetical protein